MSYLLALETSGEICSVALSLEGKVFCYFEFRRSNSHSEVLNPMIDYALTTAGIDFSQLAAVAVSGGPGSYTGLRIGVSAAKGICYAAELPLIAVDTLQALALNARKSRHQFQGKVCAMLDARRMEVYARQYDAALQPLSPTRPFLPEEEPLSTWLAGSGEVICAGNGADKCEHFIKEAGFTLIEGLYPRAFEVAELAHEHFIKGHFEDLAYYVPFYLKDFRPGKPKAP